MHDNEDVNKSIDLDEIGNLTGKAGFDFSSDSIAWPSDSNKYGKSGYLDAYKDAALTANVIPPPFWSANIPKYKNGYNATNFPNLHTDHHFQVWMRTAGLPTFRKLYGSNPQQLPAGSYNVTITNRKSAPFDNGSLNLWLIYFNVVFFLIRL